MKLRSLIRRIAQLAIGCTLVLGLLMTQGLGLVDDVSAQPGVTAIPIKACVIVDGDDQYGNVNSELYKSVSRVLEYNRIPWSTFDVETDTLTLAEGGNPLYSTVIILASGAEIGPWSNTILSATALGTGVVATRPEVANTTLDTIFGIQTLSTTWINFDSLSIVANAFSLAYEDGDSISQPDSQLLNHQLAGSADVVVTARSGTGDYPSIWVNTYQEARTVYFNNNAMYTWYFQGLLLQGILYSMPMGLGSPVAAGAIQVDDSPRTYSDNPTYPNYTQDYYYNFYNNFLRFLDTYNLQTTMFISFSYSNNIADFWLYPQGVEAAARLLDAGHELGLHCGSVHVPLVPEYNPWFTEAGIDAEVALIMAAFDELSVRLQQAPYNLPPLGPIVSYVAAANDISTYGYIAIDAGTDIKYVGVEFGLTDVTDDGSGNPPLGGPYPAAERDFGWEPGRDLFNLPRTQGDIHVFSPDSAQNTPEVYESAIANLKCLIESGQPYTIFTHPDENIIIDPSGNLTMAEVFSGYTAFADYIVDNYPFFRWLKTAELGDIMDSRAGSLNATWDPVAKKLLIANYAAGEALQIKTGLTLTNKTLNGTTLELTFGASEINDPDVFKQGTSDYFIYPIGTGDNRISEPTQPFVYQAGIGPSVTTGSATAIAGTSATLNFNLTDFGTAEPDSAQVFFQYGYKKNAAGNILFEKTTTPVTRTTIGSFGVTVNNLLPGRTYFFRAIASTTDGADTGEIASFESAGTPVVIIAGTATAEGGTPLSAATVKINGVNKGLTNGDGTYSVTNETAGDLIINISKTGYQAESQTVPTVITNFYIVDFTGAHALKAFAAPVVTLQPTPVTVVYGNDAEFTAAASGMPTPTVKWQESLNNGSTWTDIPGATSTTLTIVKPSVSMTGRRYKAVFSNEDEGVVRTAESNSATLTVTPMTLTVTGITASGKVYDATTAVVLNASGASLNGILSGDVVNLVTTAVAGNFVNKNVGPAKTINISGLAITGASAGNYTLVQPTATAAITARVVTVGGTFTANNKVYDGNTSAVIGTNSLTLTGVIAGDTVSLTTGAVATFADKNVGNNKVVSLSASSTFSGTDAGNYSLSVTGAPTATANITTKTVTPNITTANKVYDGSTTATISTRTLTGAVAGDDIALSGGTATFNTAAVGNNKTVTATGLTLSGTAATNYTLSSTTATTTANITSKPLTVTGLTGVSRVYDGTTAAIVTGTAALSGVIAPDVVTLQGTPSFAFGSKNVATNSPITTTGYTLGGAGASNYSLTPPSLSANLTAKSLTVGGSFTANNKEYDGNTSAVIGTNSLTLTGVIAGDTVSLTTGAVATFADKNVGNNKVVSLSASSTFSGTDAGNYSLSVTGAPTATANITTKTVTPNITTANKVYDGSTTATISTRTLTGAVAGDDIALSGGTATFNTAAVGNNKTVTATGLTLSGTAATNYTLSSTTATTTANITSKPLTVTGLTGVSRVYDGTTAAIVTGTAALSGVIAPDVVTLQGTPSFAFGSKNVATNSPITTTGYTLGGAGASNYSLTPPSLSANLTAKSLTVGGSFTANNKEYDGNTSAVIGTNSLTLTGVIAGDTVSLTTGAVATFADKNVGNNKVVSLSASSTFSGTDAGNYSLSVTGAPTATANITTKTVTPNITTANKVYDGSTTATISTRTLTGAVAGDDIALSGGTATFDTAAVGNNKTVTATGLTLSGTATTNYTLSSTTATTTADITASGGGGSSGGGGGFGNQLVGINLSGTSPWMDGNGRAITTGQIHTQDNKLGLIIPIGTAVWNAAGAAQGYLSAGALIQPPVAPPQNSLVIAWEMGPNGVTFTPAITLTVNYTESDVPSGTSEADLYIAWWDGSQWVKLQSTVDTAANTVSAQVSHFTTFALMAKQTPPPTTTQPPPTTTQPPPTTTQSPPTTTSVSIQLPTTSGSSTESNNNSLGIWIVVVGGAALLMVAGLYWRSRRPAT